jgi:hypothetical protein
MTPRALFRTAWLRSSRPRAMDRLRAVSRPRGPTGGIARQEVRGNSCSSRLDMAVSSGQLRQKGFSASSIAATRETPMSHSM